MDGMAMPDDTAEIDLGPTVSQLFHGFVWVGLGALISVAFVVTGLTASPRNLGSVVIGGVVGLIALASGALEYRGLPGAVVSLDARQVVVRPRRGDAAVVMLGELDRLELVHRAPFVESPAQSLHRETDIAPRRWMPWSTTNAARAQWRLLVIARAGSQFGEREFPIGADPGQVGKLAEACRRFGVRLFSEV